MELLTGIPVGAVEPELVGSTAYPDKKLQCILCRLSRHLACHLTTESSLVTITHEFGAGYRSIVVFSGPRGEEVPLPLGTSPNREELSDRPDLP